MRYTKGALILVESEEYSDKAIHGLFRVLRDFDTADYAVASGARYEDDIGDTLTRMIADDVVLEIDYSSMWLGAYDTTNPALLERSE